MSRLVDTEAEKPFHGVTEARVLEHELLSHIRARSDCFFKGVLTAICSWKWGGKFTEADGWAAYYIEPQTPHARTEQSFFDGEHWWDTKSENPREDLNRLRKGKNGQEWDLVVMHQCIHGWRSMHPWDVQGGDPFNPPPPGEGPLNCMGLVEFGSDHTGGYHSWDDCWSNTWELLSWRLIKEGAISVFTTHKGGCCQRCWAGINEYEMPARL